MAASAHVALLRGLNVGGKNRLPMRDLAAIFSGVGCTGVRTYIQSGNVLFDAPSALGRRVPRLVADEIARSFGFEVPVVTRTVAELGRVAAENPFVAAGVAERELHVAFLADEPTPAHLAALDPDRSPPDEIAAGGREIYLRCPGGVARTRLTNAYFDRTLATISTMRNWRTVLALVELAGA